MKVGRNDPCHCGSGKKYKKCCLNKATSDVSVVNPVIDNFSSAFDFINETSCKIARVIKQYNLNDVITAVFCINIWRPNRSSLAQCYAVNKAIMLCNDYGQKTISSYEDFTTFYKMISKYTVSSYHENVLIDDFGEVYINIEGKRYPIVTGTGHSQVYAVIRLLPYICSRLKKQEELLALLSYLDCIITTLKQSNNTSQKGIAYELPTEDLWVKVTSLFQNEYFHDLIEKASKIMGIDNIIERSYFIEKNAVTYPLWNPGLLVDYYHSLHPDNTEYAKHAFLVDIDHMYNSLELNNDPIILLEPKILDNNMKVSSLDTNILLVTITKESAHIFITTDETQVSEKTINHLELLHKKSTINLAEPFCRDSKKGNRVCSINPNCSVRFIKVYPYTDIEEGFCISQTADEHPVCSLLDLVYMFGFSNLDDIFNFFDDKSLSETTLSTFGGISNEFFHWQSMNQNISIGAELPTFLFIDSNVTEQYVYDYFRKTLYDFPSNNFEYFRDPIYWLVHNKEDGYSTVAYKSDYLTGGYIRKISPDVVIFISNSFHYFKPDNSFRDMEIAHDTLIDLCEKLCIRYESWIRELKILHGKVLHLLFIPEDEFRINNTKTYDGQLLTCSTSYGKTTITIRYTIDIHVLFDKLMNTTDRTVENQFLLDLMLSLRQETDIYKTLKQELLEDQNKKKTVSVYTMNQKYVISPFMYDIYIKKGSLLHIKNNIASICKMHNISQGEYHKADVTRIIRIIQPDLIKNFEAFLATFDKKEMHKKLMDYYAYQINGIYVHRHRFYTFTDLDDEIQQQFSEKTIQLRENNRVYKLSAEYLIESNLYIQHTNPSKPITDREFNYLLAYAYWLCELQEVSDICYNCPDIDSYIQIDNQYILDTYRENEYIDQQYINNTKRKYNINDYSLKYDEIDIDFLEKVKKAFYNDTGVDYSIFLSLLEYLCLDFIHEMHYSESNLYEVDRSSIVSRFKEKLLDKTITEDSIEKAIDFIILNPSLLKTYGNNKQSDILPTWEREKRNNRFEVKPILFENGKCIFSPIVIYQLLDMWRNGTLNWFPPYELGMDSLSQVLIDWKERYEHLMVQDIKTLFDTVHFTEVLPEMELHSRFPNKGFPNDLGDYDVFAIDEDKKEIWLIESKVFHKVGSIFEDLMLQKSVFYQHKYDEKFQRRIDYIINNLNNIISVFNLKNDTYTIIPFMVTNKLFYSRYKRVSFDIITFSELKSILFTSRNIPIDNDL